MRAVLIHVLFIVMGRVTRQCFIHSAWQIHKTVFYSSWWAKSQDSVLFIARSSHMSVFYSVWGAKSHDSVLFILRGKVTRQCFIHCEGQSHKGKITWQWFIHCEGQSHTTVLFMVRGSHKTAFIPCEGQSHKDKVIRQCFMHHEGHSHMTVYYSLWGAKSYDSIHKPQLLKDSGRR